MWIDVEPVFAVFCVKRINSDQIGVGIFYDSKNLHVLFNTFQL